MTIQAIGALRYQDTVRVVDPYLPQGRWHLGGVTFQQDRILLYAMAVGITGALALRLGYQVRHNTDVLPGIEKTDTLTTVGLLYETK